MDNLLANYGSSDDEEKEQTQPKPTVFPSLTTPNFSQGISKTSIFSSLPPPKSSLFNSLPPPKSNLLKPAQTLTNLDHQERDEEEDIGQQQHRQNVNSESASQFGKKTSKHSSLFSSLPPPKTQQLDSEPPQSSPFFSSLPPPKLHNSDSRAPLDHSSSSSVSNTKRIVQFKLPINPFLRKSSKSDDEDDDEEEEKERKRSKEFIQTPTVKSFLSSIPVPKNSVTLGALPSALGSGRRSILEADVPASNYKAVATEKEMRVDSNVENYASQWVDKSSSNSLGTAGDQSEYTVAAGGGDPSNLVSASENYVNYDTYGGYGNSGNYGHYESNWVDGSATTAASDVSGIPEYAMKVPGKRGRMEVPQEIVEVKQDELIKNRPREDQVKLTGIAFGPSYQISL
ncbi:uncharacterized protein LOC132306580 isoform X2 [Cornus florida]|uniref:uncharacterized protein LOC132306580 isoform X2 n=1 Tax=Cornus florida TaxID=4283 RepID=UPI0028A28D25|nr:uncharacterized protein LOC132306580 isoform X2 [Cornus florida]